MKGTRSDKEAELEMTPVKFVEPATSCVERDREREKKKKETEIGRRRRKWAR